MKSFLNVSVCLLFCATALQTGLAEEVQLIVTGAEGEGLLPGNINPPTSSNGSGGIGSGGIVYDTDSNLLNVDIEWGSGNGYSDLTGDVTLLHLHGPTASTAPDNFGEVNPQILVNLGNSLDFVPSGSSGGLNSTFFLSEQQEMYLLQGRTYINVHTNMYEFGEIRGYLVPVAIPEPATGGLMIVLGLVAMRRRR